MTDKSDLLFELKWLVISVAVCFCVGVLLAVFKVMLFEQTQSGRFAVHRECVLWNDQCVSDCEQAHYDNPRGSISCDDCCLEYSNRSMPFGKRLSEVIRLYGGVGAGFGVTVFAVIIGDKKKARQNKQL